MVWLPDWKWEQLQQQRKASGKGGGGGGGASAPWVQQQKQQPWKGAGKGGGGGKGKSGGKGRGSYNKREKIRDTSKVVWIGGLPEGVDFKELKAHAAQFGEPKWAETFGKAQGVIGYGTEDEAQAAIAILTGTELNGSILEVDVWEKTPKKAEGET
mmetsp:Transcript_141488/g.439819  ORF Transcript_141488/g.439819 Transcript_141488/m.439819 type:complete len:156 (-) Transcript_141488:21-488(-)